MLKGEEGEGEGDEDTIISLSTRSKSPGLFCSVVKASSPSPTATHSHLLSKRDCTYSRMSALSSASRIFPFLGRGTSFLNQTLDVDDHKKKMNKEKAVRIDHEEDRCHELGKEEKKEITYASICVSMIITSCFSSEGIHLKASST